MIEFAHSPMDSHSLCLYVSMLLFCYSTHCVNIIKLTTGVYHILCSLFICGCLELYYYNMVEWFWWNSSLIFDNQLVSFSALTLLVWSSGL